MQVAIGETGVSISRLGVGVAAFGNLYRETSDADAFQTVQTAFDAGLRYFDVAPHYGLGLAEQRLGIGIADLLERPVISTKVGRLLEENPDFVPGQIDDQGFVVPASTLRRWDLSADGIRRSIDSSLTRLGVDHIDIAYLHDPDEHRAAAYETALPALIQLRDEGVLGAIGAGMNQSGMLTDFVRDFDIDIVLIAGRYSLLDRSAAEDLLPMCLQRGTSVVVGGVFNSGLLADPSKNTFFDYAPANPELIESALRMEGICLTYGVSLRTAAIQYVLRHPAVACALIGMRTAAHVRDAVASMEVAVPEDCWSELGL